MNFNQLNTKINNCLDYFSSGYIAEQYLKNVIKDLHSAEYEYDMLKERAVDSLAEDPTNQNALEEVNNLTQLGKKIDQLKHLIERAQRALKEFKAHKEQVKKLESGTPPQSSENSAFSSLPNEILIKIFNNLSFYEKQKYRTLSTRVHDAIESSYINEQTLIYPIMDINLIIYIDQIKLSEHLTISDYFSYLNDKYERRNNHIVFQDYLMPLVHQEVSKVSSHDQVLGGLTAIAYWINVVTQYVVYSSDPNSSSDAEEIILFKIMVANQFNLIILAALAIGIISTGFIQNIQKHQVELKYGSFFNNNPQKLRSLKELIPVLEADKELIINPQNYSQPG